MNTTKPRTTVSIKVTGLALCFHTRPDETVPMWNIVLICDGEHKGHIKVEKGAEPWGQDLYHQDRDVLVKITSGGFDPTGASANLGDLFNLREVHDLIPFKANLKIDYARRPGNRRRFVWIQVPYSSLLATDLHDVVAIPTSPKLPAAVRYDQKGQTAVFTFHVTDDFTMDLGDHATPSSTKPVQSFPVDATPIEISLDNGCGEECTHNDFEDIYDFISDRRLLTEVRFQTWSVSEEGLALLGGVDHLLEGNPYDSQIRQFWADILSAKYGNCDPIGIDPPPEP